jgi:hypothetical protein
MSVIQDWGTAIITALSNALALLFAFIPRFIGFLVILLVGWIIATLVSKALTALLRKVGFERMANRIGLTRFEQRMGVQMDAAGVLGRIVYWFLFLIFLVPATDALGLPAVSNVLNTLVEYLPNVFVAIVVLFLGALAATVVADLVRGATASTAIGNPNVFATIARVAILGFTALIALEQLHIAPALLNELFAGIVGAAALAFGLAFGLGGREAAQRMLNRAESRVNDASAYLSTQQRMNQATDVPQMSAEQRPMQQSPTQFRRTS